MDLQKSSTAPEPNYIFTKSVAIYSALVVHLLECFLTWRQLRLQRAIDPVTDAAARKTHSWRLTKSWWLYIATVLVITFDAIPWLWRLVQAYQTAYLPSLGSEFWRSSLFLMACGLMYMVVGTLVSVVELRLLKDSINVEPTPIPRWDKVLYDITKGKPVPAMILCLCFDVLLLKACGLKLQGHHFLVLLLVQISSIIILYPIYLQYRTHRSSPLGSGALKDGILEAATEINFPLKRIDVVAGPLESLDQGVQFLGWPRKTNIVIHEAMLDRFNAQEILSLLASRFGEWKLRVSLAIYMLSMLFFVNMFTYILLFIKQRAVYEDFGFVDEYPLIPGLILFAVAFARPCSSYVRIQRNLATYRMFFISDKHAADNGHLTELQAALGKIAKAQQEAGEIDWMFSMYYNGEPTISERLARLEKIASEKAGKEDFLVEKKEKAIMA